eukprot:4504159-Amphidinium_carterae.2
MAQKELSGEDIANMWCVLLCQPGVRDAVTAMVEEGFVSVRRFVGEAPPWHFSDRTIEVCAP